MSRTEVFFLVVIALMVLVAYLPRILLWWVRRKVEQHIEAMSEPPREEQQTESAASASPSPKSSIADDEGEYVPFEEVK